MPVTHRILRPISGVDHLPPGSLVDVTGWRTVDKLVDQRYLEPLSPAEVEAHNATKGAKIDKVKTAETPKNSKPLTVAPTAPPTGDEQPPPTGDEQPKTAGSGPGKSGKPPQAAKN
jgi:hypothetical protein